MASRFLVTGVQIGMIKGMFEVEPKDELSQKIIEIIDDIIVNQYVGDSTNDIKADVEEAISILMFRM